MSEILTSKEFDKSNNVLFYCGSLLAFFLFIGALVIFFFYLKQEPKPVQNLQIQKTAVVQETFNKNEWIFEVLYPEHSASQAASVLNKLRAEGYTIQATGSAEPDQKTITLRVSPEMKDKADGLLKDLSKFFKITSITTDYNARRTNAQLILNGE